MPGFWARLALSDPLCVLRLEFPDGGLAVLLRVVVVQELLDLGGDWIARRCALGQLKALEGLVLLGVALSCVGDQSGTAGFPVGIDEIAHVSGDGGEVFVGERGSREGGAVQRR